MCMEGVHQSETVFLSTVQNGPTNWRVLSFRFVTSHPPYKV